jgi:hypothetical protein
MRIIGCISALALAATLAAGTPAHKRVQGFSYLHDEMPEGPWSAHVVKIDRSNPNLELETTLPPGRRFGLVKLSAQVKGVGKDQGQVIAAINGDYYENNPPYTGDPQGLQIIRGELVSAPFDWTCFWMDPAGKPNMGKVEARFEATMPDGCLLPFGLNCARGDDQAVIYTAAVGPTTRARGGIEIVLEPKKIGPQLPLRAGERYFARVLQVKQAGNSETADNWLVLSIGPDALAKIVPPDVGDTVRISTATSPDLKGVRTAIGGGPAILRERKNAFPRQARVRHPRSVVGWSDRHIYLVEVDGRQRNLSVGMTFEELADYLRKIGCTDAMSLDGGGSSTLWAFGQVMNNPSEGRERGAANGLVVLNKEAH